MSMETPFDDGDLYDLLLGNIDYGLDYYLRLAREANGPVLDIACGTGRTLIPCLQAGIDVDGLDLFPDMLAMLRRKAGALDLHPKLYQSDMSSFDLPRCYALIMIPFNAFVHNLTTEAQIATLVCCRDLLLPGGLLALDTYFPGVGIVTAPQNTRELELEQPDPRTGGTMRMYDTRSFDRVRQLQYSRMEIEFLDASGVVTEVRHSETTVRWIYLGEMELLLRVAGFDRWRIFGGFDGKPLDQETDAMVVNAWRK